MVDNPKLSGYKPGLFLEEKGRIYHFFPSLAEFCSMSGTDAATYRARPLDIKPLIPVFPTQKRFPRF